MIKTPSNSPSMGRTQTSRRNNPKKNCRPFKRRGYNTKLYTLNYKQKMI